MTAVERELLLEIASFALHTHCELQALAERLLDSGVPKEALDEVLAAFDRYVWSAIWEFYT